MFILWFLENAVLEELSNYYLPKKQVFYWEVSVLTEAKLYDCCNAPLLCFVVFLMVFDCINYVTSNWRIIVSYEFRHADGLFPM
jgi:hypothetical protein